MDKKFDRAILYSFWKKYRIKFYCPIILLFKYRFAINNFIYTHKFTTIKSIKSWNRKPFTAFISSYSIYGHNGYAIVLRTKSSGIPVIIQQFIRENYVFYLILFTNRRQVKLWYMKDRHLLDGWHDSIQYDTYIT